MATSTTKTNKPINPRSNDQSPKGYNRAALYSGKALDFDGVNDYVDLDGFTLSGTTATFSFAFNSDDLSVLRYFFDASDTRFIIGAGNTANYLTLYTPTSSFQDIAEVKTDEWYKLDISINGTSAACYLNGVLVNTLTIGEIDLSAATLAKFGSARNGAGLFYNGKASNFKIFNTALTAAQVADLYNNPEKVVPTGLESNLKLWLPMMEGAGTTAYDGSGNGNHGTIAGATYVNGIGAPVAQSAVMDWNKSSNYIDKSEEFETASWTENALLSINDDSFIAPDGSATATEIIENTLNTNHFLAQTLSVTAGDYFISVYAKKRDYDFIQLSTGGDTSRYANFNISTGATGNANGITDLIIEDAGNGWYRIGGKITTSSTSFNYFVTLIQSDVASRFQTYTGTDKGQYIWGAQATKSATLQPYLRNIGTSAITDDVLLPQGLTTGRDITGVNLFENVRKQGALNLDGNSWAEVHDNASLDITDAITLECWFYDTDEGAFEGVIGKWKDSTQRTYAIIKNNGSNNFLVRVSTDGSAQAGPTITNTDYGWIHLVMTYDGASIKGYKNGVYQSQAALTGSIATNDIPVEIGRYGQSTNSQYTNQIAQPRIYNRALTAEEVQRNYNAGKNTYTN